MCIAQGRNKVRWPLRQKTSLPPPCSNVRLFVSKCLTIGQWFIVSYDSANKQVHNKKPLHWANQPQQWTLDQMKQPWRNGWLDVIFHWQLNFSEHVNSVLHRGIKAANILKVAAGRKAEERHLLMLYKSLVLSVVDYALPMINISQNLMGKSKVYCLSTKIMKM